MTPSVKNSSSVLTLLTIVWGAFIAVTAQAQWTHVSEDTKQDLGYGCWKIDRKIKASQELAFSLIYFCTTSTRASLEIQERPKLGEARPLSFLAAARGAIAGCNGGYFSPDFGPAGLEIIGGIRRGEWFKRQLGGTLYIKNSVCYLTPDESFQDDLKITGLVQCSPLLVSNGTATFRDDGKIRLPRTFICTDEGNRWIIGGCQKASLGELAAALVSQEVSRQFKVMAALNLDGGPSSCLWWKPATASAQSWRDGALIRNVFLILPK